LPPAIQSSETVAAPTDQIGFSNPEAPKKDETPGTEISKLLKKVEQPLPVPEKTPLRGVPAETSLKWLKNGNLRFVKRNFRGDGKSPVDRQRLVPAQNPHEVVLIFSDSRVPPELIFDQALGEIFLVRVLGEALDTSVIASLESAVTNLGTHLIVVMGHDNCVATSDPAENAKKVEVELSLRSAVLKEKIEKGNALTDFRIEDFKDNLDK
jgi:carbonic anhydrase